LLIKTLKATQQRKGYVTELSQNCGLLSCCPG
jgi:hypothetical protein